MMDQSGSLSFGELILNASLLVQLVMAFLLVLSIISWTIIFQKNSQYKSGRVKADDFEDKFWSGIDLNNLYQDCVKRQQELVGLEVIYAAGFKEFVRLVNSGPADQEVVMDGTYRQMKVASSREVEALENNLSTLATIGSISPYIGLFGTVWGIMHAFVALSAVQNATLAMVAPPIAEALIATAMGLFAAIPAVMFYNRFVTKVDALENRYLNFMDEFATILNRRLVTIRAQLNKAKAEKPRAAESAGAAGSAPSAGGFYQASAGFAGTAAAPVRQQAVGAPVQSAAHAAPAPKEQPAAPLSGGLYAQSLAQHSGNSYTYRTRRSAAVSEEQPHYPPPGSSLAGRSAEPFYKAPQAQPQAQAQPPRQVYADYSAGGSQAALKPQASAEPHYITPGAAGSKYK